MRGAGTGSVGRDAVLGETAGGNPGRDWGLGGGKKGSRFRIHLGQKPDLDRCLGDPKEDMVENGTR